LHTALSRSRTAAKASGENGNAPGIGCGWKRLPTTCAMRGTSALPEAMRAAMVQSWIGVTTT
jgi:hypothetical protein